MNSTTGCMALGRVYTGGCPPPQLIFSLYCWWITKCTMSFRNLGFLILKKIHVSEIRCLLKIPKHQKQSCHKGQQFLWFCCVLLNVFILKLQEAIQYMYILFFCRRCVFNLTVKIVCSIWLVKLDLCAQLR